MDRKAIMIIVFMAFTGKTRWDPPGFFIAFSMLQNLQVTSQEQVFCEFLFLPFPFLYFFHKVAFSGSGTSVELKPHPNNALDCESINTSVNKNATPFQSCR